MPLKNRDFSQRYTGSCLQRVRLLRAPGYNEQIILSEKKTSHWHQCLKSSDIVNTAYNEHIFNEMFLVVSETQSAY